MNPDADAHRHDPSAARVAAAEEPPRTWGTTESDLSSHIEPRFVLISWLLCLLATVVISAVATGIVALASDAPLLGETNTELGVLTVISAFSTFLGFAVVMALRLTHVAHDRLLNSMSVAAVHVALALLLFLGDLALRGIAGVDVGSVFTGPWTDEVGNVFVVLERSSVAAIAACLLAVGMVPARGGRPAGTQTDTTPTDLQM